MSLKQISDILQTIQDDDMKEKQNELIAALGGMKKIIGLIVDIGSFFDETNNFNKVLKILNDINGSNDELELNFTDYEYKPLDLPTPIISDKCLDHHYDVFISNINDKDKTIQIPGTITAVSGAVSSCG
eukprot:7219_1